MFLWQTQFTKALLAHRVLKVSPVPQVKMESKDLSVGLVPQAPPAHKVLKVKLVLKAHRDPRDLKAPKVLLNLKS
jgi:hypothetical protein